ncbi:Zinc finger RING-type protein [Neofusicoccum parvum]|uniref:Zinc finger RING-type protein n=1 Tax=Neofusicoccum parvum TaxID=310453 RepID=A0ACB5RUS7_9PEZI|nr:Zinc finger RING-type protein [Neofusicoccum parvum]
MSKKAKSHASSSRAAAGAFGAGSGFGSGASFSAFGASASPLSYVSEPPDLSSISDANTVVAFKNLSKKDSTTKAKALEDLQSTIASSPASVEEAVLEAWLAHTVQGQIAAACGKRIAKHMPKVVGAWLSGLYDNDKSVSLAAQASFSSVFSTPEKMHNLRKAFQQQILEYCRNVIDKESSNTLSDERNTSPDDAEAKYSRVIASSIAVIASLLTELSPEELGKEQSSYEEAMQDGRIWDFSSYSDPAVRRAIHRLLRTCMAKQREALSAHLSTISKSYLSTALNSDQTGSAYEFSETLVALTTIFPTVWTEHYTSKKTPVTKRLRQFLKRGSQGGPTHYWDNVNKIITRLPKEVLPSDSAEAVEILSAIRSGIISKDEPRSNLGAAYTAYFNVTAALSASFPGEEQQKLLAEMVLPLILQYIKPSQETATWVVPGPQATKLISQALEIPGVPLVLEAQWEQATNVLVEDMKTSLPAQSKDYDASQRQVNEVGQRWAAVASKLLEKDPPPNTRDLLARSSSQVIKEALELLNSRNDLTQSLSVSGKAQNALQGLTNIVQQNPDLLRRYVPTPEGSALLQKLVSITENPNDEIAEQATSLENRIKATLSDSNSKEALKSSIFDVISRGLVQAAADSVSPSTLVELAKDLLNDTETVDQELLDNIVPTYDAWQAALKPFLDISPHPTFAITNPLGGGVYLVKKGQNPTKVPILEKISLERQAQLYKHLLLTVQLTNDNVSRATSNDIFNVYNPHTENDVVEVIADIQALITTWTSSSAAGWSEDASSESSFVRAALDSLRESSKGLASESFYNARAYASVTSELIEMHGWPSKETASMEETLKEIRRSNGLRQLVLLNIIVANQDGITDTIAKQRLVFFVKHLTGWLELQDDESIPLTVRSEVYRAFSLLLPLMKDIYGEHWENILNSLTSFWSSAGHFKDQGLGYEEAIPCIHASLKLYSTLRALQADEDPNEDLVEIWKSSQPAVSQGLIELLKQSEGLDDYNHQPLKIVNELLSRQISSISGTQLENTEEQAAFDILHKQIPAAQEEISVNAALEKTTAQLPDELLSLVLEPPSKEVISGWDFNRAMPLDLRGYLFSWLLIFDHFTNSSYKVKTDYIEHLQKEGHVPQLLDFLAEFLGHTKGRPIDISKFDVAQYDPHATDTPLADARYLAAHLYFLTLQHLPSLAKSWWIDCKSRQTVLAVESWTERFISPHIITAALSAVSEWANSQDNAAADEALTIKVNQRGKEITAGYEVDEQFMTIVIRLPPTYPLAPVVVEGVNRVAVSEQKWQSWLRNCQGVVTFSNGNLVDGLISWRRNVVGALKGQTECAICYSIISADKQLPSKRCGTCKNLFHTSCLYKWFKSSNASSCPLCRNPFNYG